MTTDKTSILEILNQKWVTPLFAIITTALGCYFYFITKNIDIQKAKLENLEKRLNTELRQKEFNNTLKITLYKEVKEAIKSGDSNVQNATKIIVNELLQEDTVFREKLKTILISNAKNPAAMLKKENLNNYILETFANKKKSDSTVIIKNATFKIDIFYLEETTALLNEAKPRAEKLYTLLKQYYPKYTINIRLFPKEINAKAGYRIGSNQIRYEPKTNEQKIAEDVLNKISSYEKQTSKIFDLETPKLYPVSNKTSNYISIFIRNR